MFEQALAAEKGVREVVFRIPLQAARDWAAVLKVVGLEPPGLGSAVEGRNKIPTHYTCCGRCKP